MTDDDLRYGNYPGRYRHSSGYHEWLSLRAFIAETMKIEVDKIWYFFLSGHIGDHVSALCLAGAFKQVRGNPPIAIVTDGPTDLTVLFGHCADRFFRPSSPDCLSRMMPLQRFAPGYPFFLEPHFQDDGRLLDLFPACTFMDLMRFILRLPMHTPVLPPQVPVQARVAADQLFTSYELPPGRTVLLAPYSNSAPRMSAAWWIDAAAHLKRQGFVPVTNVPNHYGAVKREEPIAGTLAVDVPLVQLLPFVERAGHFLATVQGLCDLVAFARAKLKIIQTPARFVDGLTPEAGPSASGGYSVKRNYAPAACDEYDLDTDAPFDPALLASWT
ncbi:MAG: hypothetical protein HY060_05020 [Proteobacteria bacterium]|nr:hypothetical protein [Pseudomonadota bacterium]